MEHRHLMCLSVSGLMGGVMYIHHINEQHHRFVCYGFSYYVWILEFRKKTSLIFHSEAGRV